MDAPVPSRQLVLSGQSLQFVVFYQDSHLKVALALTHFFE